MQKHLRPEDLASFDRFTRANIINSLSGFKSASLIGTVNKNGQSNLAIFSNIVHIGADPALVREAIRGGFAGSKILEVHGERMLKGDFAARATATVQLKDMNNALDAAAGANGYQLPITTLVRDMYASLCENGGAGVDHSGLFLEVGRINGKAIPK